MRSHDDIYRHCIDIIIKSSGKSSQKAQLLSCSLLLDGTTATSILVLDLDRLLAVNTVFSMPTTYRLRSANAG